MGCSSSLVPIAKETVIVRPIAAYRIPLDQAKKDVIRKSWKLVEPVKSVAGQSMFMRMFTNCPGTLRKFPNLRDVELDQLMHSHAFYKHSLRVMVAVENAVSALDDAEVFTNYLRELGRRHASCLMKKKLFAIVGDALLWTFKDMLHNHFTAQDEEAWTELFGFITDTMVEGAADA